jgi:hypothetical protein
MWDTGPEEEGGGDLSDWLGENYHTFNMPAGPCALTLSARAYIKRCRTLLVVLSGKGRVGTIVQTYRLPDYVAVDVRFEDGSVELYRSRSEKASRFSGEDESLRRHASFA